uniref:Uncharacterized protein n=1 Tax=Polytomella parva TaxID=51329 RepID=A0A7S0V620_9CHLO
MSLPVTIQKERSQECSLESDLHYHEGVSEENNFLNNGDDRHIDGLLSSRGSITGGDKRRSLEENPHYTRRISSPKYILSSNGSSSLNSLKSPDISTSLRIPLKNKDIVAQNLESTTEGLFITTQQHSSQIHRLIAGLEFLESQVIRQDQTLGKLQKQVAVRRWHFASRDILYVS